TDALIALQDMGAAGLTSSSAEMASKGGSGIDLDLDRVPQRETGMTAYEMLLSESQERMLAVLKPGREGEAERIFRKWELDFAVIGTTTDTNHFVVRHKGQVVADIPVQTLAEEAPVYQRPLVRRAPVADEPSFDTSRPVMESLLRLIASPDLCSRRWIWQQYDWSVMADTVQPPGGDAAIVRIHGTDKALAITTDVTPRYCKADPYEGAKQAVAEAWRNLNAVGAKPLAVTDNLNFGNPEKPEIMGEIAACIDGIAEACRAFDFPVVSGNCSLYNETNGEAILPTPAIGAVGLVKDVHRMATLAFKREGDAIVLVGETNGHLGQSLYLREIEGREAGPPPRVDLATERRTGEFVRGLIESGAADTVHDISDGGLVVALSEMAMAGGMGARIACRGGATIPFCFGEDQGRYLVAVPAADADRLLSEAKKAGVEAALLGSAGGNRIAIRELGEIAVAGLRRAHEAWFPGFMGGGGLPPAN
ncbi:MAG: AIR synthase-related protein, partial [Rhizomicrobium sp.]